MQNEVENQEDDNDTEAECKGEVVSQERRIYEILQDKNWHSNFELCEKVAHGGAIWNCKGRIFDLRERLKAWDCEIVGHNDYEHCRQQRVSIKQAEASKHWYKLVTHTGCLPPVEKLFEPRIGKLKPKQEQLELITV